MLLVRQLSIAIGIRSFSTPVIFWETRVRKSSELPAKNFEGLFLNYFMAFGTSNYHFPSTVLSFCHFRSIQVTGGRKFLTGAVTYEEYYERTFSGAFKTYYRPVKSLQDFHNQVGKSETHELSF